VSLEIAGEASLGLWACAKTECEAKPTAQAAINVVFFVAFMNSSFFSGDAPAVRSAFV
jgi:hypothetical protein